MQELPSVLKNFNNYLLTVKGRSPETIKVYTSELSLFLRWYKKQLGLVKGNVEFDNISIDDVTADMLNKADLNDLYSFLTFISTERNVQASGRSGYVSALKTFFYYLKSKAKLISDNPAFELEKPKKAQREPKFLTFDESKTLLQSITKVRDRAIVALFLTCGVRLSELTGINISDIKNNTLTVIGKGNKQRSIPLTPMAINMVNEYLKVRGNPTSKDKNALFLSELRKRDPSGRMTYTRQRISKSEVQKLIKLYLNKVGLGEYSTHKLRHTCATQMYQNGAELSEIKEILGHESIATTQIYVHTNKERVKAAVNMNPLANLEV